MSTPGRYLPRNFPGWSPSTPHPAHSDYADISSPGTAPTSTNRPEVSITQTSE